MSSVAERPQALVERFLDGLNSGSLQLALRRRSSAIVFPEQQLRVSLLQPLYGIRIERLLLKKIHVNLLSRWFMDLRSDDPIWPLSTFTITDAAGRAWPSHQSQQMLNKKVMPRLLEDLTGAPEVIR